MVLCTDAAEGGFVSWDSMCIHVTFAEMDQGSSLSFEFTEPALRCVDQCSASLCEFLSKFNGIDRRQSILHVGAVTDRAYAAEKSQIGALMVEYCAIARANHFTLEKTYTLANTCHAQAPTTTPSPPGKNTGESAACWIPTKFQEEAFAYTTLTRMIANTYALCTCSRNQKGAAGRLALTPGPARPNPSPDFSVDLARSAFASHGVTKTLNLFSADRDRDGPRQNTRNNSSILRRHHRCQDRFA